MALELTASKQK